MTADHQIRGRTQFRTWKWLLVAVPPAVVVGLLVWQRSKTPPAVAVPGAAGPLGFSAATADSRFAPRNRDISECMKTTPENPRWPLPACSRVDPEVPIAFSCDRAMTFSPEPTVAIKRRVSAIIPLDTPGAVFALVDRVGFFSTDAGCTFQPVDTPRNFFMARLARGAGDTVYGVFNRELYFYRFPEAQITRRDAPGKSSVIGLGASRSTKGKIRIGDRQGFIWESPDYGTTWRSESHTPYGDEVEKSPRATVFDPEDLDRAVYLDGLRGASITFDGTRSWREIGVHDSQSINEVAFSPRDRSVVWAYRTPLDLLRSTDGGVNFKLALPIPEPNPGAHKLISDPSDANAVFFWNTVENTLYRFDNATKELARRRVDDWRVFAPSPATPEFWYLGLGPPFRIVQ